jgi:hypothetical protein
MNEIRSLCAGLTLALVVSGCSGGGGFTTASLLGTPEAKPALDEPTERALFSASTSARASKCGYNFDPGRLRESFLASEAANGATPEQMAKLSQSYDFTRATVSKQIANPEEYCSTGKTREVSAALTRQLAGDFKAPKKPPLPKSAGWWDTSTVQKPMNTEEIFNPTTSR